MVNITAIEQGIGEWVVVRTYSAGVHFGRLFRRDGMEVVLTECRRLWSWQGANTLHEVASVGPESGRVSDALPWALLTQAIEVLPLDDGARQRLGRVGWTR